MTDPSDNRALSGGAMLSGVLLGAWLVACDGWVKILARAGCCDDTRVVGDAAAAMWSVPADCKALALPGGVELVPAVRGGATPLDVPIGDGVLHGGGLFAIAILISIVFLVWRKRAGGDALALGTLWAGVGIHGLPRLVGPGTSFTEIAIAGVGLSIGDLALAWAGVWLAWRLLAELRG